MKTSILALISIAFATAAQAHYPAITSSANVSGAINNNVSSSAFATGLNNKSGSSSSGAGSSASTTATAIVGSQHDETIRPGSGNDAGGWKGSVDVQASGSTNTKIDGYGFNVSNGTGTGGGTAAGWSDAGSKATVTGTLYQNLGTITVSGQSDTGHPTFNAHGPDLALSVGTDQSAAGVAGAGGTYAVTGHVDINKNYTAGQVSGAAADTKAVTDYAFAVPQNFGTDTVLNGLLVNKTAITVLNAGSESTGSAAGSFATSIQNVTGNFSGPTAPVFTNAAN